MKNLAQYIKEEYERIVLTSVKVVFDIFPEEFILNAPETYSESDVQIYIGDVLLKELPSENIKYQRLFGKNRNNISDAYFEYDKFEHLNEENIEEDDLSLKWDSYYDYKSNKNPKLDIFKINKLKYIILFSDFELLENNEEIKETLDEIFSKLDSSNINKYSVEIKYNPDLLEFIE